MGGKRLTRRLNYSQEEAIMQSDGSSIGSDVGDRELDDLNEDCKDGKTSVDPEVEEGTVEG